MPFALACAARTVVMIGIFCASAALRILTSSSRGILPLGVLMMNLMSPFLTRSSTFGRPSRILKTFVTGTPAAASVAAVPLGGDDPETEIDELARERNHTSVCRRLSR